MQNQTIEIADLIKPKFQPGQMVYAVNSDTHGVESVKRVLVDDIRFTVSFTRGRDGKPYRETSLVYGLLNYGEASESRLFASMEDVARSAK